VIKRGSWGGRTLDETKSLAFMRPKMKLKITFFDIEGFTNNKALGKITNNSGRVLLGVYAKERRDRK